MSVRLKVNPIACEAHGMCAEVLPERIALDDWGYPIIEGTVDERLVEHARKAVSHCPVRALKLVAVSAGRS